MTNIIKSIICSFVLISPGTASESPQSYVAPLSSIGYKLFKGMVDSVTGSISPFKSPKAAVLKELDGSEVHALLKTPPIINGEMIKDSVIDQAIPLRALQSFNPEGIIGKEVELTINNELYRFKVAEYMLAHRHDGIDWMANHMDITLSLMLINSVLKSYTFDVVYYTFVIAVCGAILFKVATSENFAVLNEMWQKRASTDTFKMFAENMGYNCRLTEELIRKKQTFKLHYFEDNIATADVRIDEAFGKYKILKMKLKCVGKVIN